MMFAEILSIIRLSMELALEISRSMPEAERAAFWRRHNERMEFWHGLLMKFQPKDEPPKEAKP